MRIEKSAGRLNTWFALGRNLFSVGGLFGITPMSVGMGIIYVAYLIWAGIQASTPSYVISLLVLLGFAIALNLFASARKAWAVKGIKKIQLSAVADACDRFEERYWNFVEAHTGDLKAIADLDSQWPNNPNEIWNKKREAEDALMRKMKARLGSDVAALMAMFSTLEIDGNSDFRSLHWSDSQARYYGAIGKLLRHGLLEEARKLKRHDIFF